MDEHVVEVTLHLGLAHFDANSIPNIRRNASARRGQGTLGAIHAPLDGMLRIAPTANVPPIEIIAVLVTENQEEPLSAPSFTSLQRIRIDRIRDVRPNGTAIGQRSGRLRIHVRG